MVCGEKSTLMWPEFFQLSLEELILVVGDCLFVEDENLRDIITLDLYLH